MICVLSSRPVQPRCSTTGISLSLLCGSLQPLSRSPQSPSGSFAAPTGSLTLRRWPPTSRGGINVRSTIEGASRPLLNEHAIAAYAAAADTPKQIGARRELLGRDFDGNAVSTKNRKGINDAFEQHRRPSPQLSKATCDGRGPGDAPRTAP